MEPVKWAPNVYRKLRGVFCIYKPTGLSCSTVLRLIKSNLTEELNSLPCYKHEYDDAIRAQNLLPTSATDTTRLPHGGSIGKLPYPTNTKEKSLMLPDETDDEDLTEHRLVLGNRYIRDDIKLFFLNGLSSHSSGVMMMGLGTSGQHTLGILSLARFLKVYHVKGRLGYATQNSFHDGIFVQRTSFRHISKAKLDKICSSTQSGHQRLMFQYAGVDPNSDEAYKLASTGIIRPQSAKTPPILYSVKCIDFNPPDFALEIHSINEKCWYLADLIHDIGIRLKSTAVCTHIHRIRYGYFDLDHTLLKKEWHIDEIIKNMRHLEPLLHPNKLFTTIQVGNQNCNEQETLYKEELSTEAVVKRAVKESASDKGWTQVQSGNKIGNSADQRNHEQEESRTGSVLQEVLNKPVNDDRITSGQIKNHYKGCLEKEDLNIKSVKQQSVGLERTANKT